MSTEPVQLSLSVSLLDDATFANFYSDTDNHLILKGLQQFAEGQGEQNLVIWGSAGVGLSHLLQACCHRALLHGFRMQYLPVAELLNHEPEQVFDGLDEVQLVCLDDVQAVAGHAVWERALFHLFNRLRERGHRLLMASHSSPAALPWQLPDLQSRVLGSLVYQVHPLSDEGKAVALQMRAQARGMDLSQEVARYILSRATRDTRQLFNLLNRLDEVSLQQQRKLTIPFIKSVEGW